MSSHAKNLTKPFTVPAFKQRKVANGQPPIAMLTAYDALTAKTLANSGIETLLVGDSLAMTQLGHSDTLSLTMAEMCHHVKAVARGVGQAEQSPLVIADMPFMSVGVSVETGVTHAGQMLKEGGAHAVKMEGASPIVCETIRRCVDVGIPVMGHLGLTPQSVNQLGGFKLQSKSATEAEQLLHHALILQQCGVFGLVLEMVPVEVATVVTEALDIPTIGIGAGAGCDGQVLVIDDLLGRDNSFTPKFLRRYANLEDITTTAAQQYKQDVETCAFPNNQTEAYRLPEHTRMAVHKALETISSGPESLSVTTTEAVACNN